MKQYFKTMAKVLLMSSLLLVIISSTYGQQQSKEQLKNLFSSGKGKLKINQMQSLQLKDSQSKTQQLDSILYLWWNSSSSSWNYDDKDVFTYSNGLLCSIDSYYADDNGWEQYAEDTLSYDNEGNLLQVYYNNWYNQKEKDLFSYDNEGNLSAYTESYLEQSSYEVYDSIYDESADIWERYNYRDTTVYGDWYESYGESYAYNNDNLLTYRYMLEAESDGSPLDTSQWILYNYNTNGIISNIVAYTKDASTQEWATFARIQESNITYNSEGQITQMLVEYTEDNSNWEMSEKVTYQYDNAGNSTSMLWYEMQNGAWAYEDKDSTSYNLAYTLEETLAIPTNWYASQGDVINGIINNQVRDEIDLDIDENGNWVNSDKNSYYYSTLSSSDDSGSDDSSDDSGDDSSDDSGSDDGNSDGESTDIAEMVKTFTVYPNPVSSSFTIVFESDRKTNFELYNTQGQVVISKEISSNENLSLSSFPAGIYYYTVNINGALQVGKIVKE